MKFDCLAVNINGTDLKVDSYRAKIALRVRVFCESQKQTRLIDFETLGFPGMLVACGAHLSYSGIANEEEFEEIVVVVGHCLLQTIVVVVKWEENDAYRSVRDPLHPGRWSPSLERYRAGRTNVDRITDFFLPLHPQRQSVRPSPLSPLSR